MKLNKPPVSEEQTILEDYVEFLLTDLSNVHPLKKSTSKNISDLVSEKKSPHKPAPEKHERDQMPVSFTKGQSQESHDKFVKNESTQESSVDRISTVENEHPKWSTIEKASAKRKQVSKKLKPEDKQVSQESTVNQDLDIEQAKKDINANPADRNSQCTPESSSVISQSNAKANPNFIEESEEEQLKEWDKIITQEKEQAYIAEHLEDDTQEPSDANDVSVDKENVNGEANVDAKLGQSASKNRKGGKENSGTLLQQTREIIDSYLPEEATQDPRLKNVEKLLSRISLATMPKAEAKGAPAQDKGVNEPVVEQDPQHLAEAAQATFMHRDAQRTKDILPEVFQTLIFQVGQLPLAVPLLKLGGIIKVSQEDITPLVGTPEWFMGLVPDDRGKLMVIDTQKYLMPEQAPLDQSSYQYLIVLDNSNWALACNSVGDAKNLTTGDIRWSEKTSRRPWFAGMVVDYMSALIEVDELINMLAANITD